MNVFDKRKVLFENKVNLDAPKGSLDKEWNDLNKTEQKWFHDEDNKINHVTKHEDKSYHWIGSDEGDLDGNPVHQGRRKHHNGYDEIKPHISEPHSQKEWDSFQKTKKVEDTHAFIMSNHHNELSNNLHSASEGEELHNAFKENKKQNKRMENYYKQTANEFSNYLKNKSKQKPPSQNQTSVPHPTNVKKSGPNYRDPLSSNNYGSSKGTYRESTNVIKRWSKLQLENFMDGKLKGKSRPGRVKKSGASCDGSVSDLRKKSKNSSGEKAKMYHWCANMKSGKK